MLFTLSHEYSEANSKLNNWVESVHLSELLELAFGVSMALSLLLATFVC